MKGLFILGALLAAACDSNLTTPVATVDTPFWLHYGEHRRLAADEVTIGFLQVLGDSRCPRKYRCTIPGSADIRLSLSSRKFGSTSVRVAIPGYVAQADTCCHLPIATLGYEITLLQLDPWRAASETIQPSDYKALLQITRTP